MDKTILIYGSTTGTCEDLAQRIAAELSLNKDCVINVSELSPKVVEDSKNLILGTSTWGAGELQDDWYDGLEILKSCDLKDKNIAIFGCGDSVSYSDTFCGGMAQLWDGLKDKGGRLIGQVSTDGYTFDDSDSANQGMFLGLALDEVNESDRTNDRISTWVEQIKTIL